MADDVHRTVLALLERRGPGKTACPSEIARSLARPDADWRAQMDAVHRAVDALVREGRVTLSWQGRPLEQRSGPYRIALPSPNDPA